jgi:hypothetical protein
MKRHAVIAATLAPLLLFAPLHAIAQAGGDQWRFTLTPYLWLSSIDGTLKFSVPPGAGGSPSVDVGPNSYLENLSFALMLAGEARRGDWAIISDLIYLDFSGESSAVKSVSGPGGVVQVPVNANTSTGLKGLVWELAASYTVARSPTATFEVLGGFRYLGVEASVQWQLAGPVGLLPQAGSHTDKVDLWDAIVGVRGRVKLGSGNWYVPYYVDAGGGSSTLTWQGMTGIGYSFRWGDALLAYRHLYYDQKGDKLLQDISFSGPALAVTFRF